MPLTPFRSPIKPGDPATFVDVRAQDDGPLRDMLELRLTALSPVSSPKRSRSLSPGADESNPLPMKTPPRVATEMALDVLACYLTRLMYIMGPEGCVRRYRHRS